jgi:hypothetical protein
MARVIRLPGDPAIMHPSEVLGAIIGRGPTTWWQAIAAVYHYADKRSLVADGQVSADTQLKALFGGREKVELAEIYDFVPAELTSTGQPVNESPSTFLLTWNPKKFLWDSLKEDIGRLTDAGSVIFDWSCGRSRKPGLGDRVFLMRQGVDPKGIVGSGTILTENREESHWEDEAARKGRRESYVTVEWEAIIDAEQEAPLARLSLKESFPKVNWDTQVSGITISDDDAGDLEKLWGDHLQQLGYELEEPDEPEETAA